MFRSDSELQRIHLLGTLTTGALLTLGAFQPIPEWEFCRTQLGKCWLKNVTSAGASLVVQGPRFLALSAGPRVWSQQTGSHMLQLGDCVPQLKKKSNVCWWTWGMAQQTREKDLIKPGKGKSKENFPASGEERPKGPSCFSAPSSEGELAPK